MAINLHHQTVVQFATRFWAKAKTAYLSDRPEFERLVWWIWARIQDGSFTNDQVRQSFNAAFGRSLTLAQWNSYVTSRLIPIKDRYLARIGEGEL